MVNTEIDKLGGLGTSEVGKLFTERGLKAKTAQTLAYEKACELLDGYKKEFTTVAMQHGIFNEEEAYFNIVQPIYPNSILRSSNSIIIKDGFWTTPDVTDESESLTLDIKCPYTIYTFFKNVNKLPATYYAQNQAQLIGTGHKRGEILLYLTSNKIDQYGNKIEYKIPIEKRHRFFVFEPDVSFQKEIMERVDGFFPLRDLILSHLEKAHIISDQELFDYAESGSKITRFKDKSNLTTWEDKIFFAGEYYVIENI